MSSVDQHDVALNIQPRSGVTRGMDRILSMPRARVYRNSALVILSGTNTFVPWDLVDYDTDGMWNAANPTRLTARTTGLFLSQGDVTWNTATAGSLRQVQIVKNGTIIYPVVTATSVGGGFADVQQSVQPVAMNAGDYIELLVVQASGGGLAFVGATTSSRVNGFQACLISL